MGLPRASCSEMWGFEENRRGWRVWLIFAVFLGLIVNFVAVIGCMSDATSSIHLYKVRQGELLAAIEIITNRSTEAFENPALPKEWYWGLSGVCDSNHHCKRAFPPTFSLEAMVENSLKAELGDDNNTYTDAMAPWVEAIRTQGIDGSSAQKNHRLHKERGKFVRFNKASAAMAILALIASAGVIATSLATASSRRVPLWGLYFCTFIDGMILLAALILAICAMNYGPRSLMRYVAPVNGSTPEFKDMDKYLGPGMYTLGAGVAVKFLAIAGVFLGCMVFGIISLVMACLALMCACACLGGAGGQTVYRCSRCQYEMSYMPLSGSCMQCGAHFV